MMKYAITILLFVLSFSAYGQQDLKEKLESRKIAFLSERLDLTPKEAQGFWPEYNAYMDEVKEVKLSMKDNHKSIEEIDDNNADKLLYKSIELEERLLDIKKKYIEKMKVSIGSKKTLIFFHFERNFKERLLKSAKERRNKSRKRGN